MKRRALVALADAIKILARAANINILIDPKAPNPTLGLTRFTNVTALDALDRLLETNNLVLIADPRTEVSRITLQDPIAKAGFYRTTRSVPLPKPAGSAEGMNGSQIHLSEAPMLDQVRTLASMADLTLVYDPRLLSAGVDKAGKLIPKLLGPVQFENVTPQQALEAILANENLALVGEPGSPLGEIISRYSPGPPERSAEKPWPVLKKDWEEEAIRLEAKIQSVSLPTARQFFPFSDYFPNFVKAISTMRKNETMREMAVAAIAIKRFQLRTGKPPPYLATLVPQYLPRLPRDQMDGRPLRYRLNADGSFVLYSVGEDGLDDGGDPGLPYPSRQTPGLWEGRDAVWPQAVRLD